MPDAQLDRVIRSIHHNKGELSNSLWKEVPILAQPGLWEEIVLAVRRSFEESPAHHRLLSPGVENQQGNT